MTTEELNKKNSLKCSQANIAEIEKYNCAVCMWVITNKRTNVKLGLNTLF